MGDHDVDAEPYARRWCDVWQRAWPLRDSAAIGALYRDDAVYRSHPHREPEPGGALAYATRTLAEESDVRCWYADPVVSGDRAAVEWWATLVDEGRTITLSGSTFLRFDPDGLIVDHVDYWVVADGTIEPYAGWGRCPA